MQIKVGATQTERNLALCLKTFFPAVKRSSVREQLAHERQNPI